MAQQRLSTPAQYAKYMDALLQVKDFGTHYYDDGAADATVLFLSDKVPWESPRDAVLAFVRLGRASLPLLIDCLDDGRLTAIRFDGNITTRPMNVPVGYVCLDILMGVTRGKPAHEPDCAGDGLGACMETGFYFRPDNYYHCWKGRCFVRPWVFAVQRTWRRRSSSNVCISTILTMTKPLRSTSNSQRPENSAGLIGPTFAQTFYRG
jgi:hypothetical protein